MSRSKWEEMTSYPRELVSAVKQARKDVAEKESREKGVELLRKTEESLASRKETPKQETKPKGEDTSLGGTIEKIKARHRMLSDM